MWRSGKGHPEAVGWREGTTKFGCPRPFCNSNHLSVRKSLNLGRNGEVTRNPKCLSGSNTLGIERLIGVCGIFPPATATEYDLTWPRKQSWKTPQPNSPSCFKGSILNYKSLLDDVENARIELDRYHDAGYLKDITEKEVREPMGHGTVSRLGLIIKEKPKGTTENYH